MFIETSWSSSVTEKHFKPLFVSKSLSGPVVGHRHTQSAFLDLSTCVCLSSFLWRECFTRRLFYFIHTWTSFGLCLVLHWECSNFPKAFSLLLLFVLKTRNIQKLHRHEISQTSEDVQGIFVEISKCYLCLIYSVRDFLCLNCWILTVVKSVKRVCLCEGE